MRLQVSIRSLSLWLSSVWHSSSHMPMTLLYLADTMAPRKKGDGDFGSNTAPTAQLLVQSSVGESPGSPCSKRLGRLLRIRFTFL